MGGGGVECDSWWFGLGWILRRDERCRESVCSWKKRNFIAFPSPPLPFSSHLLYSIHWLPNARIKQCCAENNLAGNGNWSIWSWTWRRNFYDKKNVYFFLFFLPFYVLQACILLLGYSRRQHVLLGHIQILSPTRADTRCGGHLDTYERSRLLPMLQFNVSYLNER
jgi:hypothetical protein